MPGATSACVAVHAPDLSTGNHTLSAPGGASTSQDKAASRHFCMSVCYANSAATSNTSASGAPSGCQLSDAVVVLSP